MLDTSRESLKHDGKKLFSKLKKKMTTQVIHGRRKNEGRIEDETRPNLAFPTNASHFHSLSFFSLFLYSSRGLFAQPSAAPWGMLALVKTLPLLLPGATP